MNGFMRELAEQRCDDRSHHRHSRVSQALPFVRCMCCVCMYVLLFTKSVAAVLLGGLVGMSMLEAGSMLFEPKAGGCSNALSLLRGELCDERPKGAL
jgi:hypothetical protein